MSVNPRFSIARMHKLCTYCGVVSMNRIAVHSGLLPSWKNSPIKTVPADLRKVIVKSERPPLHKQVASEAHQKLTTADSSKLLKDVSSMFDDDGDRTETEDDHTGLSKPLGSDEYNDKDMRAMFFSPSQSVNNSFNAQHTGAEYYWDRDDIVEEEESYFIDDEGGVALNAPQPPAAVADRNFDVSSSFALRSALQEATQQAIDYSYSSPDPIDLQHELKHNRFLQEHIAFLTNFEQEMNARISRAQASTHTPVDKINVDYEKKLVAELDHYLQLPAGELNAMVTREHRNIIELGLFSEC